MKKRGVGLLTLLLLATSAGAVIFYRSREIRTKTIGEPRLDRILQAQNRNGKTGPSVTRKHQVRYVLVNFWASWCPPCLEEMPSLLRFAAANKNQFLFVSVSEDSSEKEFNLVLNAFPALEPASDHLVLDWSSELGQAFNVEKLPETFIYSLRRRRFFQVSGGLDWGQPNVLDQIENHLNR